MASQSFVTPEQYLELERKGEFRHEYIEGEIVAMAGAGLNHSRIITNAILQLGRQLGDGPCEIAVLDVRLKAADVFTYPDLMVFCGPAKLLDKRPDTVTDATVVMEVLSPSTRNWDLRGKFAYYRSVPSLTDYVIVEQGSVKASHHVRQPDGSWLLRDFSGSDAIIDLRSIGCKLNLGELYKRVVFAEDA
jgi:Uma2 family endonuclease